jgi:hypothetical protein
MHSISSSLGLVRAFTLASTFNLVNPFRLVSTSSLLVIIRHWSTPLAPFIASRQRLPQHLTLTHTPLPCLPPPLKAWHPHNTSLLVDLCAGVVVMKRRPAERCRVYWRASIRHLFSVPLQSSYPTLLYFLCGKEKTRERGGGRGQESEQERTSVTGKASVLE